MMSSLEPQQYRILHYAGIPITQTFGYSVLQVLPTLSTDHAHTVGLQITIQRIVFLSIYIPTPTNKQDLSLQVLLVAAAMV